MWIIGANTPAPHHEPRNERSHLRRPAEDGRSMRGASRRPSGHEPATRHARRLRARRSAMLMQCYPSTPSQFYE
eukprot:6155058-Pyramimonas_sp.AAC.1